ncbi:MAG: MFS transporter [Burkholderiaceae bacterium]|nr:MFS transporter [Burkholderiaceae bacterium]
MTQAVPRRVLPLIVLSQFAGTSLWFAVNAVMPDLQQAWGLPATAVGTLTSAVQLGFVAGTLVFALLMVADKFSPSRVFMACALLGALANVATLWIGGSFSLLLALRFAVGFLLAGIYPVGMKIAASWYRQGLGAAMGVLIGALILGTALPHGLRALVGEGGGSLLPSWQSVVIGVSLLAAAGGLLTGLFVPESPWLQRGARITPAALHLIWSDRKLRASVFGYFGHMWELYSYFVLVPLIVGLRWTGSAQSAAAFFIIAAGFIGCVGGGLLVRRWGSARVAQRQLAISGACCLLAPLMLQAPDALFLGWLLLWGLTVSGDSPQFSTLTAQNAPPAAVGSVLTFVNCIGFAISVLSIELFVAALPHAPLAVLLPLLGLGPMVGLWMFRPLSRLPYRAPAS